jgi:haloalkane dehalogenase
MYPDYPFSPHHFEVAPGLRMHYVDEGPRDAEPVVFVHGNPTWSFYFRRLIQALRATHRCIAPDHIGMGLSDKPGDDQYDYTLARRVDDLTQLLESLGIRENVTLIVHDWGGMIGCTWATRFAQRVKRLVIFNTAAFPLPAGKRMPWQLRLCRSPLGPLLVRGLNGFCRDAVKHCVARRPLPRQVAAAYLAPYDSWANRRAVLRFVQDIPLRPGERAWEVVKRTSEGLSALNGKPMLIAWGMRDFVFDHHFLGEWVRRFPAAQVKRLEDAGHYVLEDAAEEVVPLVRAFASED